MAHVYRRDSGRPIREAMDEAGMSGPKLAEATRRVDPAGKGVSAATVGNLAGTGPSTHDRARLGTAWWIAEVLNKPLQRLFSMTPPSTVTDERATPDEREDRDGTRAADEAEADRGPLPDLPLDGRPLG